MSATKQQTEAEAKAAKAAQEKAEKEWAELVAKATDGDTTGARQVQRAIELEAQISSLREKVNDNRTYLRMMDKNDELTEDQSEFVEVFYPEKEKGERRPPAEVEATRIARAAARKNGGK